MKKVLFIVAFLLFSGSAEAACATAPAPCVQNTVGNGTTPQATPATMDLAISGAQASGNLNFLSVIACSDGSCSTDMSGYTCNATDDKANTYTLIVNNFSTSGIMLCTFYAKNIASATAGSNTVHVTITGAGLGIYYIQGEISEWSGLSASAPLDQAGTNRASSGTSISASTSSTITSANELVIGSVTGFGGPFTAGSGYTIIDNSHAIDEMNVVLSASGTTQTATFTGTSSALWSANIATFICATNCGGAPPSSFHSRPFLIP